jgi:endonuclease/exonuclease/phosphatase family metal-dependent hydrolase
MERRARDPEGEEQNHSMKRIRVVTYNIHKARGLDQRVKIERIARILRDIAADIIALQEVVNIEGRRREEHQARFIAEELGFQYQIGENRRLRGGAYGNVTLSRFPISFARNYDLTQHGREERGCLRTDVLIDAMHSLHIYNVHLGTAFRERRYQAHRMVAHEILKGEGLKGPRIILGDFNEWIAGLASRVLHSHFQSIRIQPLFGRSRSYPGLFPFLHLDRIYFDRQLDLQGVQSLRNLRTLIASDHVPIVADFHLREREKGQIKAEREIPSGLQTCPGKKLFSKRL